MDVLWCELRPVIRGSPHPIKAHVANHPTSPGSFSRPLSPPFRESKTRVGAWPEIPSVEATDLEPVYLSLGAEQVQHRNEFGDSIRKIAGLSKTYSVLHLGLFFLLLVEFRLPSEENVGK